MIRKSSSWIVFENLTSSRAVIRFSIVIAPSENGAELECLHVLVGLRGVILGEPAARLGHCTVPYGN